MVADAEGALHVTAAIFTEGDDGHGIGYFTNEGGPWTGEYAYQAVDGSDDEMFAIALDAAGRPRLAHYFNDGRLGLRFATHETGSWATAILDSGADNGRGVWWAMDDAGRQHVLYSNHDFKYEYGVRLSASENWAYEVILPEFDVSGFSSSSMAVDRTGIGHLVFADNPDDIYATNEPGTWVGRQMSEAPDDTFGENIDIHPAGLKAISLIQFDDGLYVGLSVEGLWSFELIDPLSEYPHRAWLKIDSNENIHLAYGRSDGIVYTTNTSGMWATEIIAASVIPDDSTSWPIVVIVDSADTPRVFLAMMTRRVTPKNRNSDGTLPKLEPRASFLLQRSTQTTQYMFSERQRKTTFGTRRIALGPGQQRHLIKTAI
ncbi:MAG: hypothetical protein M5R36_27805 [Deltaproteobacteria bacterium]|nr:hypothetical protein [Deltaproteobacteria bacterium]